MRSPIALLLSPGALLALLVLSASGCGYHLRGAGADFDTLPPLAIEGASPHRLGIELERVLRLSGARLAETPEQAGLVLRVLSDRLEQRVLSVSSEVNVREYELIYAVEYTITTPGGRVLQEPTRFVLRRDYTYDTVLALSKSGERALIEREMVRDATDRLLRSVIQAARRMERPAVPPSGA
jgi:LPS-assembly lipoprotein